MSPSYPQESVVVSQTSFDSDEPYDILMSNITFLNAQLHEHLTTEELAGDGLRSYYVDYFMSQILNGGFSQFVYNSGWEPQLITFVREGFSAMKAAMHSALLDQAEQLLEELGEERLQTFYSSDYFGDNPERDELAKLDDKFIALDEQENLIELNANWIRSRPNLIVIPVSEMKEEVEKRAAAIPNRDERMAAARKNEGRYLKIIRALCGEADYVLDRVTAGDPSYQHNGADSVAWHFLTDKGHYFMVDTGSEAIMFHGDTEEPLCRIEAGDQFGTN